MAASSSAIQSVFISRGRAGALGKDAPWAWRRSARNSINCCCSGADKASAAVFISAKVDMQKTYHTRSATTRKTIAPYWGLFSAKHHHRRWRVHVFSDAFGIPEIGAVGLVHFGQTCQVVELERILFDPIHEW